MLLLISADTLVVEPTIRTKHIICCRYIVWEPRSTREIVNNNLYIYNIYIYIHIYIYVWVPEVGNTAIHQIPLGYWESPRAKENLTSVGFELTTSGLDLPMLYRLSFGASTGAVRGNLVSETRQMYRSNPEVVGSNPTEAKFSLARGDSQIFL